MKKQVYHSPNRIKHEPPQQLPHTPLPRKRSGKPAKPANSMRPLIILGVVSVLLCLIVWDVERRNHVLENAVESISEPTEPAPADFGISAGAWMQNEQGYYYNEDETAVLPAATAKGIDVSKYQGTVDWQKAKEAGISYAILRCGFGSEWNGEGEYAQDDATWRANADACTELGIPFGCYLYSYATTVEEAQSEADHVARLLGLLPAKYEGQEDYTAAPYQLSLPVYYDLEDKNISGLYEDEMAELCTAFFDRLKEDGYTGEEGLYAGYNWVLSRFGGSEYDRWRDHLWIARFNRSELGYTGEYEMWQVSYTADGSTYGVESETVDVDFMMNPLRFTGVTDASANARYTNNNKEYTLWLPTLEDTATLTTNGEIFTAASAENSGKIFWKSSNTDVLKVDQNGKLTPQAAGTAIITAILPDGTQQVCCTVYVGEISVELFATGNLNGSYDNGTVSLADVAALRGNARLTDPNAPEGIVLDVGGSLQGTRQASLSGGMDETEAFSSADYDLQVFGGSDLAFGVSRLLSDAILTDGPSLASNLLNEEGNALFDRSTSWNRNRISNGMNCIVERAGCKIGFFALTGGSSVYATPNETTPTAADPLETAAQQVAALKAKGADAVVCLIGTDFTAERDIYSDLFNLGVTAAIDGRITNPPDSVLPVAPAAGGFEQIAKLTLTFGVDSVNVDYGWVLPEDLTEKRQQLESDETSSDAAALYSGTLEGLAELETGDADTEQNVLFTLAIPDKKAAQQIDFSEWVADEFAALAENDRENLTQEQQDMTIYAMTACTAAPESDPDTGEVTRGALADAVTAGTRLQLVQTTAAAIAALQAQGIAAADKEAAQEDSSPALLIADTQTLQMLEGDYTVVRDYGDTYWNVRRMINDATNVFNSPLELPDKR